MVTIPRGTKAVRATVIALVLLAGFFTLRSGLGFFLATPTTADVALQIDPTNTDAMSMRANEWLKTVQLGDEAAELSAFSRSILERSPYEAVALRNIGIITAANDDEAGAEKLLIVASRLTLRDYLTHAWLLDYRFRTGNVAASVHEADIILRQQPENWDIVMPALIALTRDQRIIDPLARTLATRPLWRGIFVTRLGRENPNPDATFALLTRMKALGAPATREELDPYFIKSAGTMPPAQLYRQWLSLLPAGAAKAGAEPLRDGDFAGLDAPPPFGWRLYPRESIYAERVAGPADMGSALYVSFEGDTETVFANQELVLAPGRYRLGGRAFTEDALGKDVFRWAVTCSTKGHEADLGAVPIATSPGRLASYQFDFVVPPGCDQQQLALIGAAVGETFDTPSVNVNGLRLTSLP